MKRLIVISMMVIFPVAMVAQVAHLKFTQDGEFASISEPTGANSSFTLNVARNTTNAGTTVNINYQASSIDSTFTNFTFVEIIGAITATDFTGTSIQNLALNFSTADLDPSAINLSCTLNLGTFIETCGPAPAGTISLTWKPTNANSTELVLHEEHTVGNLVTRIRQRSDNSTATAAGTVFGTAVVGGNATVGINHSTTLEAIRSQ
jgi:hypothetical protein